MAQHSPNRVGIALVLLLVFQLAQGFGKCKIGCDSSSGLLKLSPGTTYKYNYDGKIDISLSSAEGQQTSTQVKATVLLTQQPDCNQVLRLQNVQIIGPDGKKRVGIPDVEKPVVINSNNGALHDSICSEQGDSQNSLNLKRAIASLFQVHPEKSYEIDVFGQCPISISQSSDGGVVTITKSKNLNKCAFRESITHHYLSSTFDINSGIKSSPVLNSFLDSKQKLKNGVLESATSIENYIFLPFSVGQNGAKAIVETKITLITSTKDNVKTKCQVPKSIIFENPHPVIAPKSNVNIILKQVKEISAKLALKVEDKTSTLFINLVKLLRYSKKADILSVYNQVRSGVGFPDKEGAKKIFLDAIILASNGDTIEVAIELLKNKELTHWDEIKLYSLLPRAKHVTEHAIETASSLIGKPNTRPEALLGIGSLAGRYCAHHDCENNAVINKIIQKFISKLGDCKAANRKEENEMIFILKGLANIGYLNDQILSKLLGIAEDTKQPIRLRVAALEIFQVTPCKDKVRESALRVLGDIHEDSELRITAFIALTKCPNDKVSIALKDILSKEKSFQVGGYIKSFLQNLRTSANPDKELAKHHLANIHPTQKFGIDPRKYSFNSEFSYKIDALGVGSSAEANVIYSQNSWLPRTAYLNLTAEIFGQRLNFLEIGARQENLDKLIEHYLGPQGDLRKGNLQENWDNTAKPIENLFKHIQEKIDKSLRSRRDISKSQIDNLNKKIQVKSHPLDKNVDLDLSIRNFGSEVIFLNSFDNTEKLSVQGIIDDLIANWNKGIDELKSFEKLYRSNVLFLDAELSYPTSLGFPLRLGLDGSSNLQVKVAGNINVRELLKKTYKDSDLKISLIPSAAITVSGRFSLDTPVLENGLKVASTIHTATGGELLINTFKGGAGIDVKFNVPLKEQELIGLKHEIIFQSREHGVPIQSQRLKFSQNKDFSICIDQLSNFIGLEFCADINGPNLSGNKVPVLPFPLSGDAKASIKIESKDITTFHYRRELFNENGKHGITLLLETLGQNKKGVSLNVEGFIGHDKYVKALLYSPIKNVEAEARLIASDKEKLLSAYLKDDDRLYSAKAGLRIDGTSDKAIYNPIFEYFTPGSSSPQTSPLRIEGKIIAEKRGEDAKYTFDNVKLVVPGQKTISLSGNIGTEGPAYFTDLKASDGSLSGSVKGRLQVDPNLLKIQAELQNTLNPSLNVKVNGEFKREGTEHTFSNLQIVHGADLNSKTNVITLINSFNYKNPKALELSIKNKFSYPLFKIEGKLDLERTPRSLDYETYVQYSDVKVGSELKLRSLKHPWEYQLDGNVYALKNVIDFKSSRQYVGPDEVKLDHSISLNGKKFEVAGKVRKHYKPQDINLNADLVIKVPNAKAPWKLNQGIKYNGREIDFHSKLSSGSAPLVDALLKASKAGDALGHIKIFLKDTLDVIGHIKAQKGVGNGDLLIDSKVSKKVVKLDSNFHIRGPTYNVELIFFPLFNENKNQKIVLSTKNKYTGSNLDSISFVDILGKKIATNARIVSGGPQNGKSTIDLDLLLPEKQYFSAKLAREYSYKNGVWNSDNSICLEQRADKATAERKLTLKAINKNSDFKKGIFDITLSLAADNYLVKRNYNVDLLLKRKLNGDVKNLDVNGKITSTYLKNPIELTFAGERGPSVAKFNLKSFASPKITADIEGTYSLDLEKKPISGSLKTKFVLPSETLSTIETVHSFSAKKAPEALLEISGSLITVSSIQNLNIEAKGDLKLQSNCNKPSGSIKLHQEINKPLKYALDVAANYELDASKRIGNAESSFKVVLPQGKIIEGIATLSKLAELEYKLGAVLNLPVENHKSNKISAYYKRTNTDIINKLEVSSDGRKYLADTNLCINDKEPSIDVKLIKPDGKVSQLSASIKKPNPYKTLANIKLSSESRNFLLEGSLDVYSESLNNFAIQLIANSPNLNVQNILLKIGNAGTPDGKTINIVLTSSGKNILSGSATVSSRDEQGKLIIEGSGNFKVKEQEKSGNFKYIRTTLTTEKNGENGEEVSFDASLGNKAIDAELKVTNKEFRYLNSYCEEAKQCAHIEINAKTLADQIAHYENLIEITIDLRVLGIPNEFGLKAVTKRNNWQLDHTVDVHFENAANKYQYSVYVHPKEIGATLTTPKRIVSLEANINIPTHDLKEGGKASADIVFYTDKKNNPKAKSFLNGYLNVDIEKGSIDGELKISLVGQNKPLLIKYSKTIPKPSLISTSSTELILDIFAKSDQKIIISQTISRQIAKESYKVDGESVIVLKSDGLGINLNVKDRASFDPKGYTATIEEIVIVNIGKTHYESAFKLGASPKEALILIKYLNQVLLESKAIINVEKESINVNVETNGIAWKPTQSILELKNYNLLKFSHFLKSDPNNKLLVSAAFLHAVRQLADIHAEYILGGKNKELFHATLNLSEKNLLSLDYSVNQENIKEFSNKIEAISKEQVAAVKVAVKEGNEKITQSVDYIDKEIKQTIPNPGETYRFYSSELHKFKEELASDKTLQEFGQNLKKTFDFIIDTFSQIVTIVSDFTEKIVVTFNSTFSGVIKSIQTELIPKLREIADKVAESIKGLYIQLTENVHLLIAKFEETFQAVLPQLKALSASLHEVLGDLERFINKSYESIRIAIQEQLKLLCDEIKALPIFADLKAQYEDFLKNGLPSKEVLINTLKATTGALKEIVIIPELIDVVDLVERYLEKKINREPVDDAVEIEKIGSTFAKAITKLSGALSEELLPAGFKNFKLPAFNSDLLKRLPTLSGAAKISTVDFLLTEDYGPQLRALARLILSPEDFILPIPLIGKITRTEVFTFDSKIYHFPGTCSYLLARDVVDGNFSIIGSYHNQNLESVTLIDKSGSITVKKGKVLYDNVETDYPIRKGSLTAQIGYAYTELKSSAGVRIRCELNFIGCGIDISGFYHGQLRGLLGNGNRERYDDFLLPNGKIASSITEQGQGYSIGSASECKPVKGVEDSNKPNEDCQRTFAWNSPLSICYPFVEPNNFLRACEHAAAAGDNLAHKAYTVHYLYLCWIKRIPVPLTEHLYKCQNSLKEREVDERFEVKLPGKAVDIIVLVNTAKSNEGFYKEYAQPLIDQVLAEYKSKGITDIQYHILAHGGENQSPTHITVNGKLTYSGHAPNLKFSENPKQETLKTGCDKLDNIINIIQTAIHDIKYALGLSVNSLAYTEALDYPFRAEAIRTAILIDDTCEQGTAIPLALYEILLKVFRRDINVNIISNVEELKLQDSKLTKDIIGFNKDAVITLGEAKTKPLGNPDLIKELSFKSDCADTSVSVGANIFVSSNIQSHKGSKQLILQTIAKNIVEHSVNKEIDLQCLCGHTFANPFIPYNRCIAVSVKSQ